MQVRARNRSIIQMNQLSPKGSVAMDPAEHLAILDLCARYNRYFDEGHQESWVQSFLPDGEFHLPMGNVVARGHAELNAFFAAKHGTARSVQHLATDHSVWEEDGVVRHWGSVIVFMVAEGV